MAVLVDIGTPVVTLTPTSVTVTAPTDSLGPNLSTPTLAFVGTGLELPGTSWEAAIDITPYLGASYINGGGLPEQDAVIPVDFTIADVITDPNEPIYDTGSPGSPRIWFKYTPTLPCELKSWFLDSAGGTTYAVDMDAWTGPDIDDLVDIFDFLISSDLMVGSSAEIDINISAGTTYYWRGWPNSSSDLATGSLKVTVVQRIPQITLQWTVLNADGTNAIVRTPTNQRVNVLNANPTAYYSFYLDADTSTILGSATTNAVGVAIGMPVAIPGISTGSHALHICIPPSTTSLGELDFTVTEPPRTLPTAPGSDATGTATTFGKWNFIDPSGILATYEFPNNPTQMQSPFAGKVFSNKAATAANTITFEGAPKPASWQVSGTTLTQSFTQELEKWLRLNKRFIVVDHHGRSWTVSFETYDTIPTKDMNQRWSFAYTLTFIVYAGPNSTTFEG